MNQTRADLKRLRRELMTRRTAWEREHRDLLGSLAYGGPHDFVLQHGRSYDVELIDADGIPNYCYANAINAVLQHRGWSYVEGYAMVPRNTSQTVEHGMWFTDAGEVVQHAWGVTPDGQAAELTWRFPGAAYLGVEFSPVRAEEATWDGDATVLDDFNRGWPLLRQRWQGEHEWPLNARCRAIAREDWPALARLTGRHL